MEIKDDLLNAIAARAEAEPGYSPGLSLLVDGVFISGFVMSSTAFINALNGGARAAPAVARESGEELPEYIHLKGVRFYAGSGQQIEERTGEALWRCRISSVSGFKLGTMHYVSARMGSDLRVPAEHA